MPLFTPNSYFESHLRALAKDKDKDSSFGDMQCVLDMDKPFTSAARHEG